MEKEVEAVLSGQHTQEVHYRARVLDGTERVLLQRAVVVEWEGERPARLAGTTVDSTALVRATERAEHLLDCMTDAYFVVSPQWPLRSEERRGGTECVSPCRSRW